MTVYIVLLLAIPSRLVFGPLGSAGAPSQLFALVSLLWWGWYRISRWDGLTFEPRPVRTAMGAFAVCIGVSYVAAMLRPIETDEVSTADAALIGALAWLGTLLVAHDGIPSRDRFDLLVRRLAMGGGVLAVVGIAQFVTGQTLVDAVSVPGLTSNQQGFDFERSGFTRPSGTATHPIEFGVVLTMFLPFALHSAFHGRPGSIVARWLPIAAIGLIIPLSLSRSAVVGTIVCLLVLLPTWPRARRRAVLAATAGLMTVLFVAVPGILGSVTSMFVGIEHDPSARSRTDSYGLALEFISDAPIFGRGLGTFLPKYWILDNQLLLLAITVGLVGLGAFLALIAVALLGLVRLRRAADDAPTRDIAQTLIASIVAGTVSLAFFDGFAFPMTAGTLFLLIGMAGALTRLLGERGPAASSGPPTDGA
ncbi:O-antigen ligase family protein [Georgenia yuyongxinii]|uniref:O-antigen ligase family protein n=1 Tax=Georgenia yuyongxinii TaxID=2589797 RepID=A0A552WLB8_9MICO|nr:O-antigen ligase family protein [Georgenia yuyongxinii]TRW43570.1 O-antigen ligase family protein [Georgenia yuyongxinii]